MRFGTLGLLALIAIRSQPDARAQDSKINTNLGVGVSIPVHPTSQVAGANVNVVVGVGYNLTRHQSLVFQFMWAGLPPTNEALLPIRIAAGTNKIGGSSNLYTGTANYRIGKEGKVFGVYAIGGGGMYYRYSSLSQEVVVGAGTVCGPAWNYWGFGCVSGIVSQDETLASSGSMAFGGNLGAGFTIRIHPDGYKLYFESRYHYAPNKSISTRLIPITIGFSW